MRYYPIHLDVRGRRCLVVGGGGVGQRKAERLVGCGAQVTVVSPEATDRLARMAEEGRLTLLRRAFCDADLQGAFLVICATGNAELNRDIAAAAENRGLLFSIVDRPEGSAFVLPSVVERGALILTVSTSGQSPAFAKTLRKALEAQFGPEYEAFLNIMGAVRRRVLAGGHAPEAHRELFHRLIDGGLLDHVRSGDLEEAATLLEAVLGERPDVEALMKGS